MPVKYDLTIYDNIQKFALGQGGNYTTGCLLDYVYFKDNYKMVAIELSKKQVLDADSKIKQQISFTENLDQPENKTMFFITEGAKETIFFTRNFKSVVFFLL